MSRLGRIGPRGAALAAASLVVLALGAGGIAAARAILPRGDEVAAGVRIGGLAAGGRSARSVADAAGEALLDRQIRVVGPERRVLLTATARELGATVDGAAAARDAASIGRRGDLAARLVDAWHAREEGADVPVRLRVPADALAERLGEAKEELDARPRGARRDVDSGRITPHVEGRWLDALATAERVERALVAGEPEAAVAFRAVVPAASSEAAASAALGAELARFETRFGGPPGRDRNITRAAEALDGIVLMPGEEISFNAEVGPRSTQNGFFPAPEIYRGEMREGIGGGSCQVASTLYAAALFAGLDVTERRNHSRPSGYIRPGLDATVSYPVLDLRLRNGFTFPVVLDTRVEGGVLRARVLGRERPVEVELATETAGTSKFKRKVERAGWLAEGGSKLKQKGKNGVRIRRTLTVRDKGGGERVVTSMDVYPPTQEIWLLAPGADPDAVLPPLGGAADVAGAAPGPV
jgi:vancomycin resistance protein YoaR